MGFKDFGVPKAGGDESSAMNGAEGHGVERRRRGCRRERLSRGERVESRDEKLNRRPSR